MIFEPRKRISAKALKVWRISGIINSLIGWILTGVVLSLVYLFQWPLWIPVLLATFGLIFSYVFISLIPNLRWKRWRYEVHEEEIELQQGMFIITRTVIPMVRVQHVDTSQGPILRKYGLASVVVHTAATAHQIPALEENEAEELRVFISKLAKAADEDV